jgi:hypothetical protein
MLKDHQGHDVRLEEVAGGYRVSTRIDGETFNVWLVDDDVVVLQKNDLRLRKIVRLTHIVELEIMLDAPPS